MMDRAGEPAAPPAVELAPFATLAAGAVAEAEAGAGPGAEAGAAAASAATRRNANTGTVIHRIRPARRTPSGFIIIHPAHLADEAKPDLIP
jgi:hypothetical protein